MSRFRLVMVTRRFWPLVGGAERMMANLAAELASRHVDVTLLTARSKRRWPAEITYRGVPVVRLPSAPVRFWGTLRYMRSLARWLRRNRSRYDLVYVSMLKHNAYAAVRTVGGRVPVVLRAAGAGRTGDCLWQLEANFGRRIKRRCLEADAVVCPSRAIERELIAAGYPRDRVHRLSNGVPIPPPPGATTKADARNALAAANPRLACPVSAPVAVYAGRLHEAKGLADLVAAWEAVAADRPDALLWIAGEGPSHQALEEQINAQNLSGRVVLAGTFDDVDVLLAAADLFVLPSREEGMSLALLEAMAAGLPVVASDIPGNREVVSDGREGLLVAAGDVDGLGAAIRRLLDDPGLATQLGAAARERAASQFSLARMADRHLELFENLLGTKEIPTSP